MNQTTNQSTASCFLYTNISHFFTPSEIVDYYIGKHHGLSLQHSLSLFEENQYNLASLSSVFSYIFNIKSKQPHLFETSVPNIKQLINNDGLKLLFCGIQKIVQKLTEKDGSNLQNQMVFKILINIIYVCIDYLQNNETNIQSSKQLNQLYIDLKIDDLMMKLVTLSLQAYFIPVKKLTMLYTKILSNIFYHKSEEKSINISPRWIFKDDSIAKLPYDNLLKYGELQRYKIDNPPPTSPVVNKKKLSSIEFYYRRHNTGQCALAQSIVVGLLRSLLTVCNCQSHKKFQTIKGSGVDSFRQWQLSYKFVLQKNQYQQALPKELLEHIKRYETFDQFTSEGRAIKPQQQTIWAEFYSHKIYTTSAISCFFHLMLLALHQNMFLQYSYFLQLISDANGILVFLKFLTDKFQNLEVVISGSPFYRQQYKNREFKQQVMLTIYGVLLMLYASCNNYPQKIRNYLFQYNSYLIIKKIPTLFIVKKEEENKKEDFIMPSKEELEQFDKKGGSGTLKKLTELCYDLLKIQIPFFSKKMKENTTNMKMIIDIYCKYPRCNPPKKMSNLQKLLLKTKSGLIKHEKYITSIEEMKIVHNEYNNAYYWSNDFVNEASRPQSFRNLQNFSNLIDPVLWLEENIWKYYD